MVNAIVVVFFCLDPQTLLQDILQLFILSRAADLLALDPHSLNLLRCILESTDTWVLCASHSLIVSASCGFLSYRAACLGC